MESEHTAGGKLRASWKGWLASPERLGTLVTLLLVILVGLLAASAYLLLRQRAATLQAYRAMTRHHESIRLIEQLHQSSDDLTRMVRSYAVTGNPAFREHFYSILDIRDGRAPRPPGYEIFFWDFVVAGDLPPPGGAEGARVSMRELIERAGVSDEELRLLQEAKRQSDALVELEETAMGALEGRFRDAEGSFTRVGAPNRELALQLVFSEEYHQKKSAIIAPLDEVLRSVEESTTAEMAATQAQQADLTSALVFLFGSILVAFPPFLHLAHRFHRVSSARIRAGEERFRATFEQAAVGIAHVSTTGRFLRVNDKFCDIVGYTRDEVLVRTFQDITHPDDLDADLEQVQRLLRGESRTYSMEKRYLRDDGETIWVNLTVSLLRQASEPRWFVAVVEDISERKRTEARLQSYQRRLRALAADLTVAEERERFRISRELQEGAVQELALARMQLDAAIRGRGDGEQVRTLQEVSESLRWSALFANRIAADLSSLSLEELGLVAAVSELTKAYFGSDSGIETEIVNELLEEDVGRLDFVTRAILFRNVRELLTNVVQHARAAKVTVILRRVGDRLELVVRDDGVGCDLGRELPEGADKTVLGLFGIRERMMDLEGSLKLESAPGKGFTATLVLPCFSAARAVEITKSLPHFHDGLQAQRAGREAS